MSEGLIEPILNLSRFNVEAFKFYYSIWSQQRWLVQFVTTQDLILPNLKNVPVLEVQEHVQSALAVDEIFSVSSVMDVTERVVPILQQLIL